MPHRLALTLIAVLLACAAAPEAAAQQTGSTLPFFLQDRGTGMSTSMFGTYVRRGELLVYPFFEYYRDDDFEYAPEEFGFAGSQDFRGRYRAREGLFFVAYGLTDDLALEIEAAVIDATFDKSPDDTSAMPARISESGLGDVEGQLRWRWHRETEERPELFSYFEVVLPHSKEKSLIGTAEWEVKAGTGMTRGFRWGTMTVRAAIEYAESEIALGEYAVEYLKRVSPSWRLYAGIEGSQVDEISLIGEAQWHVSRNVFLRFNTGIGLTSRATDFAPEVGIVFSLPMR